MAWKLTTTGWVISVCTLGLAYPFLLLVRPRRQCSPFEITGEYLSKFKR